MSVTRAVAAGSSALPAAAHALLFLQCIEAVLQRLTRQQSAIGEVLCFILLELQVEALYRRGFASGLNCRVNCLRLPGDRSASPLRDQQFYFSFCLGELLLEFEEGGAKHLRLNLLIFKLLRESLR